jgi:hypothetical protein
MRLPFGMWPGLFSFRYSSAVASVKKKTAPKAASKKRPGTKERVKSLKSILIKVENQMKKLPVKATLGEYMKLIQLQKEMVADEPKDEIRVGWVDEPEETSIEE